MRVEIRPRTAVALLFAVLLLTLAGSIAGSEISSDGGSQATIQTETLDDGAELWPYTSRAETTSQRTLALNVLIYGDADATERFLREQTVGEWEELDEDEMDIDPDEERVGGGDNESTIAWGSADGAIRYTYVDPPNGEPQWLDESYQLKDGTYLGDRHHIRAYTDPEENNWTAIQAHREHWDWFHLRHTVHSIEESQSYVESEFLDSWYVDQLSREWVGNDRSSDSDGWMTVVHLRDGLIPALLGALLVGSLGLPSWQRQHQVRDVWNDDNVQMTVRALLVATVIIAFFSFVRVGAVEAELYFADANPKTIAAFFYPLLVLGLPIVTYLGARQLEGTPAFTAAALGFVVAMFFDYTHVGVTSLPLHTFIHRITLAAALGFIAAGASQTARSPDVEPGHVRTGVLLWVVAVSVPLLQFL
ncbi:hypothetical protein [Halovivax gelatinilyticus]|uniref:hypothetical protein n=1 Tax=Halovivax gelatinilyticus TaxID=2961597 RepID=UPI0020CA46D6|nr:hypothetical protein [Halovivax gelatinilyticus]